MRVNPADPTPLYAQVEAVLAAGIADRSLAAGSQLPTEDSLIARFNVSRTTIRAAIQNLVTRELVEIRRGKGTFVRQPKMTQELTELSGFVEDMQALGRTATARLLNQETVEAAEEVAQQLQLTTGDAVVRIMRLRLADGVPVSLDETYLPQDLGQKVVTNNLDTEPIFSLLEQKYGIALVDAEYKLEAIIAEPSIAEPLGIAVGSPIFMIERTSYAAAGLPVDYERLYYRGDLIRFVTRLTRRHNNTQEPGTR
ncbi:MAG TPA: GntR family transcriptional regulator [Trichormus sp.]|jgi:GntR family transcriptional regulator